MCIFCALFYFKTDQDETSLGPYMSFLSKVLSVLSFQGCSGSSRYFWVCFKACGTLFKGINLNSGWTVYLFFDDLFHFLAVLSLRCCKDFSLGTVSRECSPCGVWVSHCSCSSCCRAGALGLRSCGSGLQNLVVAVRGLSCLEACGIHPDQGSNLLLLHWPEDSSLLSY